MCMHNQVTNICLHAILVNIVILDYRDLLCFNFRLIIARLYGKKTFACVRVCLKIHKQTNANVFHC